jgi:hypothetical protein
MSFLAGRHYVALGTSGLRRHLIMKTVAVPGRRPGATGIRYVVAERRFTRRAAERRARILNVRNGRAH